MLDLVLFARSRNFILRCAIFAASAVLLAGFSEPCLAAEFKTIHLWEKGAPGKPATKPQDEPELYVKLPTAPSTGTAVIILPGGGYGGLARTYEEVDFCGWFGAGVLTQRGTQDRNLGSGRSD